MNADKPQPEVGTNNTGSSATYCFAGAHRPPGNSKVVMSRLAHVTGCLLLAGCSTTWQGLHAVDAIQTAKLRGTPCFEEKAWLARNIMGAEPSKGEVFAWWLVTAILHHAADSWLEEHASRWVNKTFDVLTMADAVYTVANNERIGVHAFRSTKTCEWEN